MAVRRVNLSFAFVALGEALVLAGSAGDMYRSQCDERIELGVCFWITTQRLIVAICRAASIFLVAREKLTKSVVEHIDSLNCQQCYDAELEPRERKPCLTIRFLTQLATMDYNR